MTELKTFSDPECDHTTGCITCGDEAVAMTVLKLDSERGLALCADDGGRRETVEIALVEATEGDVLMVHAATAIARVEARDLGGRELGPKAIPA